MFMFLLSAFSQFFYSGFLWHPELGILHIKNIDITNNNVGTMGGYSLINSQTVSMHLLLSTIIDITRVLQYMTLLIILVVGCHAMISGQ